VIKKKLTSAQLEQELLNSIVPPNHYDIEFRSIGDAFFIAPRSLNSFLKLLRTRDTSVTERLKRSYLGKLQILYVETVLYTNDLIIFQDYFESKYEYVKLTITRR